MTRQEINNSDKHTMLLQAFCVGIEVVAIAIVLAIFVKRFLPFILTKVEIPMLF